MALHDPSWTLQHLDLLLCNHIKDQVTSQSQQAYILPILFRILCLVNLGLRYKVHSTAMNQHRHLHRGTTQHRYHGSLRTRLSRVKSCCVITVSWFFPRRAISNARNAKIRDTKALILPIHARNVRSHSLCRLYADNEIRRNEQAGTNTASLSSEP